MRFLFGIVVGIVGLVVGGYFIATSGKISVAATEHGSFYALADTFLEKVSDKSIEKHASAKTNPLGEDPAAGGPSAAQPKRGSRDLDRETR